MKSVYLDNSATSFPKPSGVPEAIVEFMTKIGANVNRSTHSNARTAAMRVFETRELLKRLFHFNGEESQIIFTPGATYSINQAIRGYLNPGMRVLTGSMEHNAIMRPLRDLEQKGLKVTQIPFDTEGLPDIDFAKHRIEEGVDLIVLSHCSNVSGTIFPVEELSELADQKKIPIVLDASQSAGHFEVNFEKLKLSALCAPAHKGLLGPQGLGILILEASFAERLRPIVSGGTGSLSNEEVQPEFLPDKFESGTPNIPGIFGFHAALHYLIEKGIGTIQREERALTERFLSGLNRILEERRAAFRILGTQDLSKRIGVISLDFADFDNADVSDSLEEVYGIKTRCGLHCAPSAHRSLLSFPQGSVRFSLSHYNKEEEIDYALRAIGELIDG